MAESVVRTDLIQRPGDVNIKDIRLIAHTGFEVSLWRFFEQLDIYQDLFANCMKGVVSLNESFNLIQHVPIVGMETLRVVYSTPSCPDIQQDFAVFKVSERILTGDRTQTYTISFVSKEFLTDAQTMVSEAYTNLRGHEIVQKVLSDYLETNKTFNRLTPCKNRTSFIAPFWSPLTVINWIASRSQSERNPEQCDYVFYETPDGWNYTTLSSLKDQPSVQSYVYYPMNVRQDTGEQDIQKEFRNVRSYQILGSHDKLEGVQSGLFSSILLTHDLVSKNWGASTYSYQQGFKETPHLESYPLLPRVNEKFTKSPGKYKYLPVHSQMFDRMQDADRFEDWSLRRTSQIEQALAIRVQLEIPGDSRRRVGDVVTFEVPSPEVTENKNRWTDLQLNGRFLVTSVRARIRKDDYTTFMEISKDSLQTPIPDEKPKLTNAG